MAGLERVITDLRALSNNRLSPAGLSQGLAHALEAMVEAQRRLGLPVSLHIADGHPGGEPRSPLTDRELFYIAQEAVVNAVKHAHADRIAVSLSQSGGVARLVVQDNGQGFDVEAMSEGRERRGMGIMHARASRIGGRLSLRSSPGQGTEVIVEVNVNEDD